MPAARILSLPHGFEIRNSAFSKHLDTDMSLGLTVVLIHGSDPVCSGG